MSRLSGIAVTVRDEAHPDGFGWWVVRVGGVIVHESHSRGAAVDVAVLARRDRDGLHEVFRRRVDELHDLARHAARSDDWDDVADYTDETTRLIAAYRLTVASLERVAA